MKDKIVYRTAASVHAGNPPPGFQDWAITNVSFHGFADLSLDGPNDEVLSPPFCCLGQEWELGVYLEDNEYFIFLGLRSSCFISIEFCISLRHFAIPYKRGSVTKGRFDVHDSDRESQSFSRRTVLDYLTKGSLMCEVRMIPVESSPWVYVPINPSACETIQHLFMDEKSADVVFEVEDDDDDDDDDDHSPPTKFYAHSLILKNASSLLAELCKPEDDKSPLVIRISDVSPDAFKYVLHYIYGYDSSDFDPCNWDGTDISRHVIDAANKYGLTNLKLKAEACFVSSTHFDFDNFMELLHFANSKNCYLLQEAVMDFIVKNKIEILENKMLAGAPDSITYDILSAVARREIESAAGASENSLSVLRISELRRRAHARGLDVDGSREMLISALNNAPVPATK